MTPEFTNNPLYSCWPFWVLELTPEAHNTDIEKAAREITSKIEFEIANADKYNTPDGLKKRDEFLIREARSKLQNPAERLLAEYWYISPAVAHNSTTQPPPPSLSAWYRDLGVNLWEE